MHATTWMEGTGQPYDQQHPTSSIPNTNPRCHGGNNVDGGQPFDHPSDPTTFNIKQQAILINPGWQSGWRAAIRPSIRSNNIQHQAFLIRTQGAMQATTWMEGSQGTEILSHGSIQGTAAAINSTGTEN